jgi:hypothetical protein
VSILQIMSEDKTLIRSRKQKSTLSYNKPSTSPTT